MENIIIYGAGGFGREVLVLLNQINKIQPNTWKLIGFIDDDAAKKGISVNGYPVVGGKDYLLDKQESTNVAIALFGSAKQRVLEQLMRNKELHFPNIIHPDVFIDDSTQLGIGNIICHGCLLTCNIQIGNFNVLNGKVGIGHDVQIGDGNLFGPNSFIAGEVTIGNFNSFAMNSSVIQQRTVGDNNTVNLNSVLIKNIKNDGTYFGVPALKQKF